MVCRKHGALLPQLFDLLEVLGDERIVDGFVERGRETWLLGLDEIKEAGNVLGRLDGLHTTVIELLEHHERCATDTLTAQVLNTGLALFNRIHDHVIERSQGSSRDGDIELVGDSPEAAESTL